MADAFGTAGGVVSASDHRLAQAGLIAPQTSSLDVRTGVLIAPGSTALVTGTSATGTMTVSVAAHHWVTTRGVADGVYLGAVEAATTVTIAAAPGANSRIDVIYVKQNDAGSTISPDGTTAMVVDKATGTAAVSPTKPPIPTGALELATVTVAVGATATNGAGVTIANTARQTVARGAEIPVRNQAERDALSPFWPLLTVKRLDTGNIEVRNAANSGWLTIAYTTTVAYFEGFVSAAQSLANSATWTDIVYDGEAYDTAGGHSGSSALYTIPTTGWWNVVASVGYATAAGARGVRLATVIGGTETTVRGSTTLVPANSLVGTSVATRLCRLFLNAGDQVKVQGYQNSGAALALVTGAGDQVGTFAATFERAV